MSQDNVKKVLINISIGLGILTALYVILRVTGFFDSKTEKDAEQKNQDLDARTEIIRADFKYGQWFDKFLYQRKDIKKINGSMVYYKPFAQTIIDAWGILNDDEDKIYSVFSSMKYRGDLSALGNAYYTLCKKELLSDIFSKMSDDEVAKIEFIISKLSV